MDKKGLGVLFLFSESIMVSCVSSKQPTPVSEKSDLAGQKKPVKLIPKAEDQEPESGVVKIEGDPDCQPLSDRLQELPLFVPQANALVTKFLKSCRTMEGKIGVKDGSPWTAMGLPCTGGRGEFDWKGSQYAPKLVTFKFKNSCPMQINRQSELEALLKKELAIPDNSKLIAYYPFTVIYWEVPDFGDADVGHSLEFFSAAARKDGWNRFQATEPVKVTLYGRENALVPTKNLYQVEGSIRKQGDHEFKLLVNSVRLLDDEAKGILALKCKGLKPRRNCSQFF